QAHAVMEVHDLPGPLLKSLHAPAERLQPLIVDAGLLFGAREMLEILGQAVAFDPRADGEALPFLAGDVPDDALHPEGEVSGRVKLLDPAECDETRLLGDVFGQVGTRCALG